MAAGGGLLRGRAHARVFAGLTLAGLKRARAKLLGRACAAQARVGVGLVRPIVVQRQPCGLALNPLFQDGHRSGPLLTLFFKYTGTRAPVEQLRKPDDTFLSRPNGLPEYIYR